MLTKPVTLSATVVPAQTGDAGLAANAPIVGQIKQPPGPIKVNDVVLEHKVVVEVTVTE